MKTRIGDISLQIRGVSYKPSDISDGQASHSIAVLRANNISNDGNIETSDLVWIRGERVKSEQFLRDGDILLCASSGSKGLVGKAAQINGDCGMSFGAFCKVIRPTIANKKYLGFYFQSPQYRHSISEASAGININNIRTEDLDHLEIELPDEIEQGRRCFILDKAAKAIKLRRQQIEKLNDLVKSQFIEMFGDGKYPIKKWCDVFSTQTGKLDSNAMVEDGQYPFFTCSKETLRIDTYAFDQEALLLAGNNAAGRYDVKYYKGKFNAYQRTYVLTLKDEGVYSLFKCQLESKLAYLQQQSLGGLTKYLTMKILNELV